jgi:UDP-N-acetylmuramyl pentapeptide phosphotransferase/UDP-N-acetylglucosamine-1-phosphate transferase
VYNTSCITIALLGIFDDRFSLGVRTRLAIEFALCLLIASVLTNNTFGVVSILLALVGVALINAINFIDIKDGLCTGYTLICFILFVSSSTLPPDFTLFLILCAYSMVPILFLNSEPAKVYQGDGGSYAIAICFYVALIYFTKSLLQMDQLYSTYTNSIQPALSRISIVNKSAFTNVTAFAAYIPIAYELVFVTYRRFRLGLNPFKGSPDHIAIVLSRKKYSTYRTLLVFSAVPISGIIFNLLHGKTIYVHTPILIGLTATVFIYKYLRLTSRDSTNEAL